MQVTELSMSGHFITFEGGEGGGKSTQIRLLAEYLREAGHDVVTTREPGGSPGAESIRSLLVSGETDRWDGLTEALLHYAARRDHLTKTVWPALARGSWVLSDRFADSTMAYQGYAHGLSREALKQLYTITIGDFAPEMTLILDLPVEHGLDRAGLRGGGEDRYERMGVAFHQRLRDGYLAIAEAEPERCVVIDATPSVEAVRDAIVESVAQRFGLPLSFDKRGL
jgi:dTMP kinase